MDRRDLGRKGEYLARLYLEQKGLEFIRANYLTPRGEIDLIMRENDEIVFLEVKTRTVESARRYGRGALRIDKGKQRSMYYAASQFMREEKKLVRDLVPRFDALEIYLDGKEPEKVRVLYTPCAFGI
ncbi:MAG: YraN family protein [Clostridia bacterium]|nr:YraN family protein [Clostridia bacterium]